MNLRRRNELAKILYETAAPYRFAEKGAWKARWEKMGHANRQTWYRKAEAALIFLGLEEKRRAPKQELKDAALPLARRPAHAIGT